MRKVKYFALQNVKFARKQAKFALRQVKYSRANGRKNLKRFPRIHIPPDDCSHRRATSGRPYIRAVGLSEYNVIIARFFASL